MIHAFYSIVHRTSSILNYLSYTSTRHLVWSGCPWQSSEKFIITCRGKMYMIILFVLLHKFENKKVLQILTWHLVRYQYFYILFWFFFWSITCFQHSAVLHLRITAKLIADKYHSYHKIYHISISLMSWEGYNFIYILKFKELKSGLVLLSPYGSYHISCFAMMSLV